jgi:hypothetical protein
MSVPSDATTVTIPLERLHELEAFEATVLATKERDRKRLEALRASQDPKEHAKRALERYHENKDKIRERYHQNRDAILARRRELRKAKKEAATAAAVIPTA